MVSGSAASSVNGSEFGERKRKHEEGTAGKEDEQSKSG